MLIAAYMLTVSAKRFVFLHRCYVAVNAERHWQIAFVIVGNSHGYFDHVCYTSSCYITLFHRTCVWHKQ